MSLAGRLKAAIQGAGVAVVDVSIVDPEIRSTWRVLPAHLQAQAQPMIDAFDPDDPQWAQTDAEREADALLHTPLAAALIDMLSESVEIAPSEPDARVFRAAGPPTILRNTTSARELQARLRTHLVRRLTTPKE